jgi:hypothetical protein
MKITALKESANFATLDTGKLFSKLKSHELSRKGCTNHDASFSSKVLITSVRVGGYGANPTSTISPSSKFALSSLVAASVEQYESIPDDKIALLARKFWAMHKFRRRGEETLETAWATLSTAIPSTLTRMTTTRMTTRKRITSGTRRRETSRRSFLEHV